MLDAMTIADQRALPRPPAGWFDYGYAALLDGRLALVRTSIDVDAAYLQWRAAFDKATGERGDLPNLSDIWSESLRLSVFDGMLERDELTVPPSRWPIVSRLSDGRWIVASDARYLVDKNARIIGRDGSEDISFHVGGPINQLLCSPDGTIWIGYSDEGACSGWSQHGSPSRGGIVQFDQGGNVVWAYNAHDFSHTALPDPYRSESYGPDVCHCYALTLAHDVMWACTYTDFPISRHSARETNIWSNDVAGAKALVTWGDFVVLAGGYDADDSMIAVVELSGLGSREVGRLGFEPLSRDRAKLVQGQDGVLHVVSDGIWYRIAAKDAVESVLAH